eukprot:PhF_6_TR9697/c0_g1_i2/m.14923
MLRSHLLLILLSSCVFSQYVLATSSYVPDAIRQWTPQDVHNWARTVLRYDDVADTLLNAKVDGITMIALSHLSDEKLRSAIPELATNQIRLRKFKTAVSRYGSCDTITTSSDNFLSNVWHRQELWQLYQSYRERLWVPLIGSTLSPRVTLLYLGKVTSLQVQPVPREVEAMAKHSSYITAFNNETFSTSPRSINVVFSYFGAVFYPYLYFASLVTPHYFTTNYFLLTLYVYSQTISQLQELRVYYNLVTGTIAVKDFMIYTSVPTAMVIGAWILHFLIPYALYDVLLFLWMTFLWLQLAAMVFSKAVDVWWYIKDRRGG